MEPVYLCPKDNKKMEKVYEEIKEGCTTYRCPKCHGEFTEWYVEHD